MEGSRYRLVVQATCDWENDFTDWTASMKVRNLRSPISAERADLTPYVSCAPSGTAALITLDIPADAQEINVDVWRTGQYDIVLVPPSGTTRTLRVLQGKIDVDLSVML
jgi:hypothetical protein